MGKKSWSQVVKNDVDPKQRVTFDFVPPPEGTRLVSPIVEVLKKGNDRFKTSIVGTSTKGSVSFKKVCEFAHFM